jgi:hypothetical protein
MLLSDLIAGLNDDGVAAEVALRLGDVVMLRTLQARAEEEGVTLGAYAGSAVRRYADAAGDDEWVSLLGALARTEDPGAVFLKRSLAFAMHEDS